MDATMRGMPRVRLTDLEFRYEPDDPDGYRSGMARVGPGFGAKDSGASVYELPPGQAICPYHYEYGEEEWLLVLAGRPTLRTPQGSEQLEPDDFAFFTTGPDGAHQVRNETDEAVRVLMWSTISFPAAAGYPDSDKIGIFTGDAAQEVMVRRSSNVGYYDGEA
jgi:uncharacterized cupin superfamily protein